MQIAPGIHSIGFTSGGRVHCFLVEDGDHLILIDTGFDREPTAILAEIARIGRKPTDIRHIAITHAHRSHLGGLAAIKQLSGGIVSSHGWEANIIRGTRKAEPVTTRPQKLSSLAWWEVWALQLSLAAGVGKHEAADVNHTLREGHRIGPLEVIATPGHTPGSVSFWWPQKRVLIAGDVLSTWPEVAAGWDAFQLDPAEHQRSVGKLAELKPDVICVGHGEPIVTGAADILKGLVK